MSETSRYGYFVIMRAKGGAFRRADGTTETFEEHAKAMAAQKAWVAEELLPEATATTLQARETFIRQCTLKERRVKRSGFLAPDDVYVDILGPNGEDLGLVKDNAEAEIAQRARHRFPDPSADELVASSGTRVTETVVWAAGLYLGGKYQRLAAFEDWAFGFPIENVLGVLNDLSAEGWSVVHVSEDRGLYTGRTTQTDSAVTRARYLLARS